MNQNPYPHPYPYPYPVAMGENRVTACVCGRVAPKKSDAHERRPNGRWGGPSLSQPDGPLRAISAAGTAGSLPQNHLTALRRRLAELEHLAHGSPNSELHVSILAAELEARGER